MTNEEYKARLAMPSRHFVRVKAHRDTVCPDCGGTKMHTANRCLACSYALRRAKSARIRASMRV